MFQSEILDDHLKSSDTIKVNGNTFIEWNMNDPQNIKKIGNYRYRPTAPGSPYYLLPSTYVDNEPGPTYYYTGATDSDTVIESGLNEDDEPTLFVSPQQKMKMLFSLEDCIKPFRPRSGINKMLYLGNISSNSGQFIDDGRSDSARRPRYYMASKDDQFKYWTSFRKELGTPTPKPGMLVPQVISEVIRGVSFFDSVSQRNYIEDACPFVVYQNKVPTNKIVVKMQTNVGEVSLGEFRYNNNNKISDPLYGQQNQTTPVRWKIEILQDGTWTTATQFDENSLNESNEPIIGADGYVEISYGIQIPEQYKKDFIFMGEITSESLLPETSINGYSYLIKNSNNDRGTIHIYFNDEWKIFAPSYGWHLSSQQLSNNSDYVGKLSNPDNFILNNKRVYREFDFIEGIRVSVETMNKPGCTFDLIEFSPRLFANITESVSTYSVSKVMSDLGNSSIPVGGLFASSGNIDLFDVDFSFNENNIFNDQDGTGSIVYNHLDKRIKFIFYESIIDVNGLDFYIPIKSMYANGIPQTTSPTTNVSIQLRDFYFFLESSPAPQLLLTDISVSYAIMILLDFIGFDNYVFKRISGYPETIIPYFFVEQGQNVAEVLQKLAIASQTAMFFDEYNNFIVMSKEYLLPENQDMRKTNSEIIGQDTVYDLDGNSYLLIGFVYDIQELSSEKEFGCYVNLSDDSIYTWSDTAESWQQVGSVRNISAPNVLSFASQDKRIYNAGQINYTTRYLQRSIGSTTAALKIDEYKNYIYKPVLLWEAQGGQNRQTINELAGQMGGYVLGAVPLNTDISNNAPYALNNAIYENIIDVGENVYWMTNYQGYFYANSEIIKYDAVEYIVAGQPSPVWISNNQQYQDYFGSLPFNGKMYPSGRIRIYTDPEFEEVDGEIRIKDANPIISHGRGQFGTPIVSHSAGLVNDNYWKNNSYVRGCIQEASSYLFNTSEYINYPKILNNANAGKSVTIGTNYIEANTLASQSLRNGIIRNFLTDKYFTEQELSYKKTTSPGTIQSSALVFNGPEVPSSIKPSDFVSYIYKEFINDSGASIPYKHYGTRMRIIGNIESGTNKSQTPLGNFPIFTGGAEVNSPPTTTTTTDQEEILRGGSAGIAFNINKETNTGYYFEIMALTASNISAYNNGNNLNVVTYNVATTPAAAVSGTTATVYTESEIDYVVGQSVTIAGLSVTQMNGEFQIVSIDPSKKKFTYSIASPGLTATSTTGGEVSANVALDTNIANVFFYKILADSNGKAVPYKLWSGLTQINVDGGEFYGQGRLMGEENTTVYDLAAEYVNVGKTRKFYLYLNNKQIAVVEDPSPLEERNSLALFVRGSSKCMFENVYALSNNYSQNSTFTIKDGVAQIFGNDEIDATEGLRKYALSGIIQKTYLSGISSLQEPSHQLYFEEFGTMLREAAYFNVLYDRAYPALYAKLMKTTNSLKGYCASGFYAWSYGAEFLIFNCSDFPITIDDTSGNYLRILGAAFTQSTTYSLTVDDLYKKRSNLLDTALGKSSTLYNALEVDKDYNAIKNSRDRYGKNEITIESPYIQSTDAAEDVFGWIINKVSKPRKMIGVSTFATQNLQLGDIVTVKYLSKEGINVIVPETTRFVIYQIDHSQKFDGPSTTMYLAEV